MLLVLKRVRQSSHETCSYMKKQLQMISSGGTAALKAELLPTTIARVEVYVTGGRLKIRHLDATALNLVSLFYF